MGIIAVLLYGIMVTISTLYPDIGSMWIGAILLVILGTVIAAVVCLLVGFLVMPSLASDEVSKDHTLSCCRMLLLQQLCLHAWRYVHVRQQA